MKVSLNPNLSKTSNNINFEGYKPLKSEHGTREYEFNFVYNDKEKDCYLEIFLLDKDENGNFFVTGEKDQYGNIKPLSNYNNESAIKLRKGGATKIDLAGDYGLAANQPFAYHYKLYPKDNTNAYPEYKIDAGNIINDAMTTGRNHEIYNYVTDNVSTGTRNGAMKLIVPDCNNVSWVYNDNNKIVPNPNINRARKTSKNIANKIGGSLAGIEKDLEDGKLDNFAKIITTPLFTDDNLSAHAYWNKNCYQMAQSLGNINNYASLQRKLFAKGINLVSDGAYVNEGLEGVHFKHVLQWGEKSPYFNWFKISGLQDSPLSMGVFGKNLDNITHRVVNSKYNFKTNYDGTIEISKNKNYDSKSPTYIQIYDKRLVNTEKLSDNELIKAYDKLPQDNLSINNHNDTVVPYSFRINPETYKKNVIALNRFNKKSSMERQINLYSPRGTRAVTQFEYFGLDGKHESGFETWDANPDIAKLCYVLSHADSLALKNIPDIKKRNEYKTFLKRKNMEVQDYAVSSAQYWSKKTNQILNLNVAQNLKNIDDKNSNEIYTIIKNLSNGKVFPKDLDVNENIVKNVIKNRYELNIPDTADNYDKAILQGLMNTPLDSIEVGDDIVSVMASPYMSKRAANEDEIGVSRYDTYINGNKHLMPEYSKAYNLTDKMYEKELSTFASEIIKNIEDSLPANRKFHNHSGETTEYGKYVLPLLTAEIAKFAVIKGVLPDAKYKYDKKTGEISYNYNELKNTSLIQMGIIADSPEDETISLIKKLQKNIKNISQTDKNALTEALTVSIEGTTAKSFRLANMIVSRAQAGLDWRIDATKDIADMESIRNGKTDFEFSWNEVIKFWSKFTESVKKYHPDAYIVGEITDEEDMYNKGNGWKSGSRYGSSQEAVKKLLNESGFTTIANYTYLSSNINKIFGKLFDFDGTNSPEKGLSNEAVVREQLTSFFTTGPMESLIYSFIFAGNHDKCRALEGYAIDTDMVYADLTNINNYNLRHRAYKILHGMPYGKEPNSDSVNCYNFDKVNSLAIAKCESIISGMGKAAHRIDLSNQRADYIYDSMLKAIKNISNGKFKGKTFESEGFGIKDFPTAIDSVFEEMDYIESNKKNRLTTQEKEKLKKKTLEMILDPAMSKLLGHTKFLSALTGNPTLFAGDEYGSTGFEYTTKNITVQNRNIIREDWVDPKSPSYMEFVEKFKKHMDYQYALRTRPELQPLNDGAPIVLAEQYAHYSKPVYENNFDDIRKGYEQGDTKISALLRQSTNGGITVSVFNTEGLTHKFDEYYRPAEITLKNIDLNNSPNGKEMSISGLKEGMVFKNADKNDKKTYKVNKYNQIVEEKGDPIKFNDSVLILYHEPSFTGRRTMYNPQYNFVSQPYTIKNKPENGLKLSILSK